MDADVKTAITHPSLKLVAGTGAIVLVAGVVIWGVTHRAKTGASSSSPTGSDIGTFAPTTLTVNVPPAAFPTSAPGSSSGPSAPPSGSGSGRPKPPTHGSGGGKRPPVKHPHVKHSSPAHTSHPAAHHVTRGGSGAGGSKSSASSGGGAPTSNYYFPATGTSDFPGPQNGSSNSVPVLSGVGDFIGSLFGSPAS